MVLCALEEPNNTPSGTIHAHLPPTLNDFTNKAKNNNSVFFVLHIADKSLLMSSVKTLPLNGGLAKINE